MRDTGSTSASERFEQLVLPHLDAAYNLARWLTRKDHDAQDVVQEAYLRAFKGIDQFQGGDARCWLLTIVRNTCFTWMARNRPNVPTASLDADVHDVGSEVGNPSVMLDQKADRETVRNAIEALPVEFREVLILRELEGLSYQEISRIADVPIGTVMSRLARARKRLQQLLAPAAMEGGVT